MKVLRNASKRTILTAALLACAAATTVAVINASTHTQAQRAPRTYSAGAVPKCGSQLGIIGYSIETEKGYTGEGKPEFSTRIASSGKPGFDPNTVMFVVVSSEAPSHALVRLESQPHAVRATTVVALSSDPTYLSCDYKLRDNSTDQKLASKAEKALLDVGADASVLRSTGTAEFVSVRELGQRKFLQVAFVYLPVNGPHVSYAALLDKSTEAVVWAGQTNWYN